MEATAARTERANLLECARTQCTRAAWIARRNSTGNERDPPTHERRRTPASQSPSALAEPPAQRRPRRAHPRRVADAAQLRVDRGRGGRHLLRAALPGTGADAVPDRRHPRLPRHADRRTGLPSVASRAALATTVVVLLIGIVLLALFLVLIPLVQAELTLAARRIPDARRAGHRAHLAVARAAVRHHDRARHGLAEGARRRQHGGRARPLAARSWRGSRPVAMIVISILVNLALIPVVMFYLLRDWDMIGERLFMLVPRDWLPKTRAIAARHRPRARRVPARADPGDDRARGVLRDRADPRRPRVRARRSACSPGCSCSFRTSASASGSCSACSPRCCNGRAGRASSRSSPCTASASCSRSTCWCRISSAIASACIRSR